MITSGASSASIGSSSPGAGGSGSRVVKGMAKLAWISVSNGSRVTPQVWVIRAVNSPEISPPS